MSRGASTVIPGGVQSGSAHGGRVRSLGDRASLASMALMGMLALAPTSEVFASARSKNEEGNRLYRGKKYPEALKKYTEAQLEAPDSPQLHYNLGNVFYRQGEVEKAREEYRRALAAADRSLDPKAVYNLGNTFLSQEQYPEAVGAYQRALKLDPGDFDAKRNLELALLRLKEKQKQSQSSGDRQEKGRQQESGSQPRQSPSPSQEKEKQQAQGAGKDPRQQQKGNTPQPEKGSLTKEEAERILSALQEDEKANLKKRLEARQEEPKDVDEDW